MSAEKIYPKYGDLYEVGTIKRKSSKRANGDYIFGPARRYIGFSTGQSVEIYDTATETPVRVASHRRVCTTDFARPAVHPDGERLVVRDRNKNTLKLYGAHGLSVSVTTETTRVPSYGGWPPKTPRPYWQDAAESVGFTADGKHLLLATHNPKKQPVLMLFDAQTLALVKTQGSPTFYTNWHDEPHKQDWYEEPLKSWAGCTLSPDPMNPEVFLTWRSCGDNWDAILALRVADGEMTWIAPQTLAQTVKDISHYALHGLRLLPGNGLMVMDLDLRVTRIAWPPEPDTPLKRTFSVARLLREKAPRWLERDYTVLQEAVVVSSRHILLTVARDNEWTMGLMALDPHSLEPRGGVRRPWARASFHTIDFLNGELFATQGSTVTTLWRLRLNETVDV